MFNNQLNEILCNFTQSLQNISSFATQEIIKNSKNSRYTINNDLDNVSNVALAAIDQINLWCLLNKSIIYSKENTSKLYSCMKNIEKSIVENESKQTNEYLPKSPLFLPTKLYIHLKNIIILIQKSLSYFYTQACFNEIYENENIASASAKKTLNTISNKSKRTKKYDILKDMDINPSSSNAFNYIKYQHQKDSNDESIVCQKIVKLSDYQQTSKPLTSTKLEDYKILSAPQYPKEKSIIYDGHNFENIVIILDDINDYEESPLIIDEEETNSEQATSSAKKSNKLCSFKTCINENISSKENTSDNQTNRSTHSKAKAKTKHKNTTNYNEKEHSDDFEDKQKAKKRKISPEYVCITTNNIETLEKTSAIKEIHYPCTYTTIHFTINDHVSRAFTFLIKKSLKYLKTTIKLLASENKIMEFRALKRLQVSNLNIIIIDQKIKELIINAKNNGYEIQDIDISSIQ